MSEPRRLLDDPSQLSEDELRALARELRVEPPSGLQADVWASLSARLPPAPNAPPPPLGRLALISKATFVVLAIAGAGLVGRAALRRDPAPLPPLPSGVPPAVSAAVAEPEAAVEPEPIRDAPPTSSAQRRRVRVPAVAPSSPPPPAAPSASNPQDESQLISAARSALRAGDSARALGLLGEAQHRFAHGVLGQEREALTIEALAKSGQRASAKSRGEAFLKAYRDSPYAARIRALIGG